MGHGTMAVKVNFYKKKTGAPWSMDCDCQSEYFIYSKI